MLSNDGAKIVKIMLSDLKQGIRVLPTEYGLKELEDQTRVRPQNIGMAFSH